MATAKAKTLKEETYPVIPHLVCDSAAEAIAFYKKAFGAEEMMRLAGTDGKLMHACIHINGAPIFLVDEYPDFGSHGPKALKGSPVSVHLTVKDVDSFAKRAVDAGAKVTLPVADMFWGDRYGQLEDPFGHRWSIATHVRDMSQDEIQQAMREAMQQPCNAKGA